jgi:hypothetical protein
LRAALFLSAGLFADVLALRGPDGAKKRSLIAENLARPLLRLPTMPNENSARLATGADFKRASR